MKLQTLCLSALFFTSAAIASAADFQGAQPAPLGRTAESVSQLRIQFPEEMVKQANVEAFQVSCSPARTGFSGWADNNTIWTFDFQAPSDAESARLAGGTKCDINQVAEVKSVNGTVWPKGTIQYSVTVAGPNVVSVTPAFGFKGTLRETAPVLLIQFDGPVDPAKFFAEQDAYLSYVSANAPSEKIPLTALPADQLEKTFEFFKLSMGYEAENLHFTDHTWILATAQQNLVPGAQMTLTVENQRAAGNPDVRPDKKFTQDFTVRSQFQAEVQCANSGSDTSSCMPATPITLALNGMVKWADIKDAYIEYIPYKSTDRRTVRSYAEIDSERKIGFWDDVLNRLSYYFPFLAKYSDTVLDSVVFNVSIEPQTQAKIVIPNALQDLDGRALGSLAEFRVRIAAMTEVVRTPKALSVFEKNVPNLYLPVGVVNMNQTLSIRKTGGDAKTWQPIRDASAMINLIRAYEIRGTFRDTPDYVSPLAQLGLANTVVEQKLTGTKNRPAVLQFPFAPGASRNRATPASGLYPIEVSSPSFEATMKDGDRYYNPKYVLAQVTDLTVHLKKGRKNAVAWVTSLSNAQPVAGAQIEIYNCRGEKKAAFTTNASGLATFPLQAWADDCQASENVYSQYLRPENFFVAAKKGDDLALVHSSWTSDSGYAMGAPGVEYFWNDIEENKPHFHAVIGVNLVKPGQDVPVEIVAKTPVAHGFQDVPAKLLPTTARIVSNDDSNTYYEFPLRWAAGKAELTWHVPGDAAVVRLGSYSIQLQGQTEDQSVQVSSGDIEVAEFKVPLLSGIIGFPSQPLVQPASIPVNSVIRYANGVGAKNLAVDLSYYFMPTSMQNEELPNFAFGTGAMTATDVSGTGENVLLPNNTRPATLQGLRTGDDGSISKDLALERANDGRRIGEVIQTLDRPQRLVVRVRYQDQMGEYQTLSQAKDIYNSATYVGTRLVAGPRDTARLQAAVVSVDNKIVTNPADLDVKLIRVETRVIGEELFGGMIKNTLERELKDVRWVPSCALSGKVMSCPIGALKEGTYAFEVTAKSTQQKAHSLFKVDTDGRVYGPDDYYNLGDDEGLRQLPLALDKKGYQAGEKAVVSFSSPFQKCTTLVTLERSDVLQANVVNNACAKGQVVVPVDASLAPNAFVSVYAVTGRAAVDAPKVGEKDLGRPTYRIGFANMKINWNKFKTDVKVKTDKPKYEPGQVVNVAVKVNAEEGQLQGGTVTLVAIEEKILELKKNDTYKLLDALMQMRADNVETVTALERIETATAENADLPGDANDRKGGDEGGDGSTRSDFKRKLFNALVAFQPNVPVVNGVAKASFKTNDSLTRFKIFAVATDAGQKFGLGEAEYLTEKDTQTYSNIPSVAHTGDTFPVKVTVQNNTGKSGKFKVVVTETIRDAQGRVIGTKTYTKEATIDKSGSQAIDVGDANVGDDAASVQYLVQVYDENGKLVDELQPDPQTVLAAVPLAIHDSLLSQMEGDTLTKNLVKDADALPGKGELRVMAARSLVTGALTQVSQRLDRDLFADFFIEARFAKAMLHSTEAKPDELKAVLEAMIGYTDDHGFLKYSPQSPRGSLWLTASVINVLEQEPWTMKVVPAALAAKWKTAVASVLDKSVSPIYVSGKPTPMDWFRAQVAMGQAAFAFSDAKLTAAAKALNVQINDDLKRDPQIYGEGVEKWTNSDLVERWTLEAYAAPQTALQSDVYKLLTGPSRLVYSGNMAQLNGGPSYSLFYSDETMETAKLLYGHALVKGPANLARNLALGLVNANVKGWYNSATMLSVAEGLKGFGRAFEAEKVTGTVNIAIPEEEKSTQVDLDQNAAGGFATPWKSAQATVQVTHAGQGKPWVSVQALTAVPLTAPRGQGLAIEKQVKNLMRDSGYQAGDVLEITLNVTANASLKQVALLDPIPAGSNILSDAYGEYSSGQKSYAGYKLYFEELPNGTTTVKYQVQLNNPGTFKMPPSRAEGLYMPSIFAETPNATLKVE